MAQTSLDTHPQFGKTVRFVASIVFFKVCVFQFAIFGLEFLMLKASESGCNWVTLGIVFSIFALANLSAGFWWFCMLEKIDHGKGQLRILFLRTCTLALCLIIYICAVVIFLLYPNLEIWLDPWWLLPWYIPACLLMFFDLKPKLIVHIVWWIGSNLFTFVK